MQIVGVSKRLVVRIMQICFGLCITMGMCAQPGGRKYDGHCWAELTSDWAIVIRVETQPLVAGLVMGTMLGSTPVTVIHL